MRSLKWLKSLGNVVFILIIFGLGFSLGNGKIRIGGLKSEQKHLPTKLDYSSVQQVYDSLKQDFDGQLDVNKLLDGLKHGITEAAGDPYTDYFSPKEAKAFNDQLNGTFQGIGAELGKDANNNLIVVSPIAGFPAAKAGLKSKDIIAAIDNTSTQNMSVDQAVSKIRGPKGTDVTLKIVRGNAGLTLKITRDDIRIPSVTSKILTGNIGYIQISEFSGDTIDLAAKAANNFKQAGVKGVILDLRGDPGGELNAAVGVSSLWLKDGATVLTERRGGTVVQTHNATGGAVLYGIKTVVLIDEGSASASEITAGALRDNGAATLMGVKSFGKGSVQEIINFSDGGELKVTIARWYTPNGKNIDKQGITPDKVIKRSDDDIKAGKDPQLDAAKSYFGN
ncbi:MAG: S41 family peptidase [Candidatus Saccharimonadales bacterium]